MSAERELSRDVDVDLGGIFASVWRHKGKILFASVLATVAAYLVLQTVEPRYTSEARILIRASQPVLTRTDAGAAAQQAELDDNAIGSQVELLQSRTIAEEVIGELGLATRPEFDAALAPGPLAAVLSRFGLGDTNGASAKDRILNAFRSRLTVYRSDRSRVLVVQFSSQDPELAAKVPNRVADAYLRLQETLKRGVGPDELKKLEPEIDALRKKLVEAEAAVADYRASLDLFEGNNERSLATQELSEIATELSRVRAQRSRAEANRRSVDRALASGALDTVAGVVQSPLIQRLRERQANLSAQLSDLGTTLLPGHPRVRRLRSQMESLEDQIRREMQRIVAALREEARVAEARETDLLERRNQLKAEAGRVERDQVELRALEREADAQRELLNAYLVRYKEATSRQSREVVPADAYVFSQAQVPTDPVFPKKVPTLVGAFFGTALMGSVLAIAGAILTMPAPAGTHSAARHSSVHGQGPSLVDDGAERLPVGAAPPSQPGMRDLTSPVPTARPHNAVDVAAAARSAVMLGKARLAVLDASGRDEARTSVALVRALAGHGVSAMLVDLGSAAGATTAMLGDPQAVGVRDVMAGVASVAEAIHPDTGSGAHLLPTGVSPVAAAARGVVDLGDILDGLSRTYGFLVLECGVSDIAGLGRVSDPSTVVILAAPDPTDPSVALAIDMIARTGRRTPLVVTPHAQPASARPHETQATA